MGASSTGTHSGRASPFFLESLLSPHGCTLSWVGQSLVTSTPKLSQPLLTTAQSATPTGAPWPNPQPLHVTKHRELGASSQTRPTLLASAHEHCCLLRLTMCANKEVSSPALKAIPTNLTRTILYDPISRTASPQGLRKPKFPGPNVPQHIGCLAGLARLTSF